MKKSLIAMGCLLFAATAFAADAKKGKDTFDTSCSVCHNADSTEAKVGPGLKGLYKKAALNNKKKPSDAVITTKDRGWRLSPERLRTREKRTEIEAW